MVHWRIDVDKPKSVDASKLLATRGLEDHEASGSYIDMQRFS